MRVGQPVVLLALLCAGCGSSATTAAPCASAAPPTETAGPSARAGVATFAADRGRVAPGAAVELTASVRGPAHYRADCGGPLQAIVSDSSDIHVWSAAPPAVTGVPCGTVTVPRGRSAEYELTWPVDPTLPPGVYEATLILGDQPPATLQLRLGRAPARACR